MKLMKRMCLFALNGQQEVKISMNLFNELSDMAFQMLSKENGTFICLMKMKGTDLIGLAVKAPLSHYPIVYVLPMSTISMKKVSFFILKTDFPGNWNCY